jgi:hypothetical protein
MVLCLLLPVKIMNRLDLMDNQLKLKSMVMDLLELMDIGLIYKIGQPVL